MSNSFYTWHVLFEKHTNPFKWCRFRCCCFCALFYHYIPLTGHTRTVMVEHCGIMVVVCYIISLTVNPGGLALSSTIRMYCMEFHTNLVLMVRWCQLIQAWFSLWMCSMWSAELQFVCSHTHVTIRQRFCRLDFFSSRVCVPQFAAGEGKRCYQQQKTIKQSFLIWRCNVF